MQIEIIIIAIIVFGIMTITGQISINQLISDNQMLFMKIKEKCIKFEKLFLIFYISNRTIKYGEEQYDVLLRAYVWSGIFKFYNHKNRA